MKRYDISARLDGDFYPMPELCIDEDRDGKWIKADAAMAEIAQLRDALESMCHQYLSVRNGKLHHDFMSAGEAAFECLGWPDTGHPVDAECLCDVPECGNRSDSGTPMPDGSYARRCFRHYP